MFIMMMIMILEYNNCQDDFNKPFIGDQQAKAEATMICTEVNI